MQSPPTSPVVERDRFCKPSRLITAYSSKPFLMTPIHLERQYVTSRKNLDAMSGDEKAELCTVTVRWMGRPVLDELYLVATDVCALINIRKSNTAKTVAQFSDVEKVSMPVHCSSGKGSSTHILTALTMAGVRRLLTSSRSVLSSALLEYLNRITAHIHAYPTYVPVNDPTKASVTPFAKSASSPRPLTPSHSRPADTAGPTDVKAESVPPGPWEEPVPPPPIQHARSLPLSSAGSPSSASPLSASASAPPLSRSLSLSGKKQTRGKKDSGPQQKRVKEEPMQRDVDLAGHMVDQSHGEDVDGQFYLPREFPLHAMNRSQSPPLPPPTFLHVPGPGFPTQSPSSSYFPPPAPHQPPVLVMPLSPSFGPFPTSGPMYPATMDYHAVVGQFYHGGRPLSPAQYQQAGGYYDRHQPAAPLDRQGVQRGPAGMLPQRYQGRGGGGG